MKQSAMKRPALKSSSVHAHDLAEVEEHAEEGCSELVQMAAERRQSAASGSLATASGSTGAGASAAAPLPAPGPSAMPAAKHELSPSSPAAPPFPSQTLPSVNDVKAWWDDFDAVSGSLDCGSDSDSLSAD